MQLVLSGHTHGGQVIVPAFGAFAGRKFPVLAGFATRENTALFVSRGVGTVYVPVRINCPPDVAVLTLRPPNAASALTLNRPVQDLRNRPRIELVLDLEDARRQRVRRIAFHHRHGLLQHHRTGIEVLVHEMNSGAALGGAIVQRLLLRVQARDTSAAARGEC